MITETCASCLLHPPAKSCERLLRHFAKELLLCLSVPVDVLLRARMCVQCSYECLWAYVSERTGDKSSYACANLMFCHSIDNQKSIHILHFILICRMTFRVKMRTLWKLKWIHQLMEMLLTLFQVMMLFCQRGCLWWIQYGALRIISQDLNNKKINQ